MDSSTSWSGRDPSLPPGTADDFQQFLDIGLNGMDNDLQFDFADFNQSNSQLIHDAGDVLGQKDVIMHDQMPMTSAPAAASLPSTPLGLPTTGATLVELDAQIHFLQQQRHHQQQQQQQIEEQRQREEQRRGIYTQSNMIPPTPNSIEMHSANSSYYANDPQQQAIYERFSRMKDDMAFTPLVSPAVTPLDQQFNMPEYTVPGAYFSPLSSPALHAQNDQQHRMLYQDHSSTSPADASAEHPPTKKTKAPSKARSSRTVRQSPIVKPRGGRKQGSSTNIPAQALSGIMEPAREPTQARESSHSANASNDGSETESISPEHLSDMAPPPLPQPGSVKPSPRLAAKAKGPELSPATPASLLKRIPNAGHEKRSPAVAMLEEPADLIMEELELPEAAAPAAARPQLSRIDTAGDVTPTLSNTPNATPGFQPLPSPAFNRPGLQPPSASQSPSLSAVSSPNQTAANGTRKTPQLSARNKKRPSVHVSPALRPRISPSIKPLLPGGPGVTDDTARLLLASKSNYQNILEGTHLPGVSYPSELSTNLTSKRTSHKIAEQGRRNRINSALQEIATLLPRSAKDGKTGSGESVEASKSASSAASSKASTVEMAIEYIKQLRMELADAHRRAVAAEQKLMETTGIDLAPQNDAPMDDKALDDVKTPPETDARSTPAAETSAAE